MNGTHPAKVVPTTMGDSVGHWEGDMLVIDTVGVKVDEFTSVDRFGTPQTEAMHIVERYRLIDGATAKADLDRFEKSNGIVGGRPPGGYVNPDPSLQGLRLEVTMEDPNVFTAPLTGVVTSAPDLRLARRRLRRQSGRALQRRVDRTAQGDPPRFLNLWDSRLRALQK
jgi:hypothetical protein